MATAFQLPMIVSLSTPIFLVLVITLIIIIINGRKPPLKKDTNVELPPGSCGWGESIQYIQAAFAGAPERFMRERKDKYKSGIFKTSIFGEKVVVVSSAAWNRFLFTKQKLVRTWWAPSVKELLGPCLLTKEGDEGMGMRSLMATFVSPDALSRLYIPTMHSMTRHHIHTHWQGGKVVRVFPTLKRHWFELACCLLMGIQDSDQITTHADIFEVFLKGLISIPINFPGTKFYRSKKAGRNIKSWLLGIVQNRRAALEVQSGAQDLLSHLLVSPDKNGKLMPESEIVNNLHMLIMAGHDVSVAVTTMVMRNLAQFPEIYDKVLQEQMEIASSKSSGEPLQWEDIQKMKYSWSVICESMRMFPPIHGAFREAMADINYQGYYIPKGWKIYWSADLTHSDPEAYPDHENFDPSRFDGVAAAAAPSPFTFLAFGGGPRMCFGKEFARVQMLILLHTVITRFRWELVDPDEKIEYNPVLTPMKGLPILLHTHNGAMKGLMPALI